MGSIYKTDEIVRRILTEKPGTRDDDFFLFLEYFRYINPQLIDKPLEEILILHKWYGLPSLETITRARRKNQAKYKELKSKKEIEKLRKQQEENFVFYSKN